MHDDSYTASEPTPFFSIFEGVWTRESIILVENTLLSQRTDFYRYLNKAPLPGIVKLNHSFRNDRYARCITSFCFGGPSGLDDAIKLRAASTKLLTRHLCWLSNAIIYLCEKLNRTIHDDSNAASEPTLGFGRHRVKALIHSHSPLIKDIVHGMKAHRAINIKP